MKHMKNSLSKTSGLLCLLSVGLLVSVQAGCVHHRQPVRYGGDFAPAVDVSVDVSIHAEADFYEPLSPYGRWEVVGSYGRCWIPGRVEAGWSPYSNGYWQQTDMGWYWASDEPWGWATYHYGRWDSSPQFGWYWVPQVVWAPAWVSWRQGGGYVGWAPLSPHGRGVVEIDVRGGQSHGYVFVEERRFLDPVRRDTVIVNNTVINKTVNITKTHTVNKTVINEGPGTAAIEKASGKKLQAVQGRELRHKEEAAVATKQRANPPAADKKAPAPGRTEPGVRDKKDEPVHAADQLEKPAAVTHEPLPPAPAKALRQADEPKREVQEKARELNNERAQPVPPRVVVKPEPTRREEQEIRQADKAAEKRVEQQEKQNKHADKPEPKAQPASEPRGKREPAEGEQGRKQESREERHPQGDDQQSAPAERQGR